MRAGRGKLRTRERERELDEHDVRHARVTGSLFDRNESRARKNITLYEKFNSNREMTGYKN